MYDFIYDVHTICYCMIYINGLSSPSNNEKKTIKNNEKRKTAVTLGAYRMDSSNDLDEEIASLSIEKERKNKKKTKNSY